MSVGVVYSEMQAAANAVGAAMEPIDKVLTDLSTAIETHATGFSGQAAAGFGQAVSAWFEVAGTLGPILDGYAQSIFAVAQELQTTDAERTAATTALQDRLGGPS